VAGLEHHNDRAGGGESDATLSRARERERHIKGRGATKVGWVGRATSMVFGLALILALLFGVASMALAGTGVNSVFNLGVKNTVDAVTQLVSNTDAGPAGTMLRVDNNSRAARATGVQILTEAGEPPMKVNPQQGWPN
jgi:hypothetical protein